MPLTLRKEDIDLLWLIQPNLQEEQLEIKKKFDSATLSMEVNDLMYLTISCDFDYIYKLNPTGSSYRGNSTFFVFKVNASTQTVQDYLVLKLNEDIESSTLDSFMSCLLDYTDLLDLESASLRNETLKKIFQQFKRKETCVFNKNEQANKQDVLNSLNFHHQVYVDKDKADLIRNGGEAVGAGIVSLATMASNLIDTIGNQIATNVEPTQSANQTSSALPVDEQMDTGSDGSTGSSSGGENEEVVSKEKHNQSTDKKEESRNSRRDHRHHRHSRRHGKRRDGDQNEEEDDEHRNSSRRHRRHRRRAANLRKINEFTKTFSQTATVAASAITTAITETCSYITPAIEEYLPGMISKVTNYDEESSRQLVGKTVGYGRVAMEAMSSIKNSVSEGVSIIGSSVAGQTTQVVKNKYGDEAAEQTKDVLDSAANVATTYTTLKNSTKLI